MPAKRKILTAAQVMHFDREHQWRLGIINAPFPPLRTVIPGKIWAGALITHDDDAVFLKSLKAHYASAYAETEEL